MTGHERDMSVIRLNFDHRCITINHIIRYKVNVTIPSFLFVSSLNYIENPIIMVDNNKLFPKLSQNLLEILDDDEYYDITIEVGNDPFIKIFRAHMVILHYRSPYLQRILSTNKKKNDGALTHIKLPNIMPEIFQIILR